ncbi:hypothetical protein MPER_11712 [Moniliophthora perniciosa FA553]|nr:hypothetical protein MPER_11712 [Moniliophthora perniciosa FA553]
MMGQTEPTPSPSPPVNRPRQVTFAPRTGEVSDDGGAATTPSSDSRSNGPENPEPREWHLALDAAIARHSDMLPPTATVTVANSATGRDLVISLSTAAGNEDQNVFSESTCPSVMRWLRIMATTMTIFTAMENNELPRGRYEIYAGDLTLTQPLFRYMGPLIAEDLNQMD